MATANELFAANGEDYIVIDSDLRTMTFPASVNNIGVENDKDVHKLNFKMPRYFSGYDLSEFIIHINYVNANGDADMYYVLDPTVEENEIIFSWLVGRHACLYRGFVTFIVCLKLADGEGDVAQEFNTTLASLQVLPGLETEPTILETEHDIIEQLLLSINDTNAKIKAVLDTGLTPEQIAEFYDKSKTYDTQIATLNSRTNVNVIYTDTQVTALGGVNAAIADAVVQKKFPENVAFSGMIQVKSRYYIDGYIYTGYKFGSIWLHKFNNDALFVSIMDGSVSISKLPTRSEVDANTAAITELNSRTIPWISYDGQLEVTLDDVSFSGISTFAKSLIKGGVSKKWLTVRINASDSAPKVEPFYGSSFALTINCSSANYGWGWLQSDNTTNHVYFGYLNTNWTWCKVGKQDDIDALTNRLNNNGAWNELLGSKTENGDYTLNDSYAGYKSVVVMLFGSGNSIASCIYPTTMLITAGYHPVVEVGSNKVEIVFTSSTSVTVSSLNGSVRIYGIR